MTIVITNNVPRPVLDASEIPLYNRERDFDYLDWEAIEDGRDSASFFRFRGDFYDLNDGFIALTPYAIEVMGGKLAGWQAYQSDSYFSGLVIRYSEDFEEVTVGRYCS